MGNKLDKLTKWDGKYKGIKFEIIHWYLIEKEVWNYYLLIYKNQLPARLQNEANLKPEDGVGRHKYYAYSDSIFSELGWHGGITFYQKEFDEEGELLGYKVGCDYIHYWDEGKHYDLNRLLYDCQNSIDKLWEQIPDMLIFCQHDGSWHKPNECPHQLMGEYSEERIRLIGGD